MTVFIKARRYFRRQKYRRAALANPDLPSKVVFLHTVKTGGTSINAYFKEYIGSGRDGRMVRFDDFVQSEDRSTLIERAHAAKYVGGHISWDTFQKIRDERTYSFTIFREPYDRLRSLYHYFMNFPEGYRGASTIADVKGMSLREFLTTEHEWVRFHTDNFVARQFAGSLSTFPVGRDERERFAERAIANISTMSYRGFHDDYERAFADIVRAAGLPVPSASPRVNVTATHISSAEGQEKARQAFDDEMRELARPLVEADSAIYEHFNQQRTRSD